MSWTQFKNNVNADFTSFKYKSMEETSEGLAKHYNTCIKNLKNQYNQSIIEFSDKYVKDAFLKTFEQSLKNNEYFNTKYMIPELEKAWSGFKGEMIPGTSGLISIVANSNVTYTVSNGKLKKGDPIQVPIPAVQIGSKPTAGSQTLFVNALTKFLQTHALSLQGFLVGFAAGTPPVPTVLPWVGIK